MNPFAGFVTGLGYINSSPGYYTKNPAASGRAYFSLISKYKKGKSYPEGRVAFIVKEGWWSTLLYFKSTSYDWLVVNGADCAKLKGEGVLNGSEDIFGFMITGCDKGRKDTLRIQIWSKGDSESEAIAEDAIVYDNMMGTTDVFLSDDYEGTVIAGGRIKIRKGRLRG